MLTHVLYVLHFHGALIHFLKCHINSPVLVFPILSAIQGCRSHWIQPRIDCFVGCWRATDYIPCWQLCIVHVRPEDLASQKKEASLQEEVEEGETEARCCSTRRIDRQ